MKQPKKRLTLSLLNLVTLTLITSSSYLDNSLPTFFDFNNSVEQENMEPIAQFTTNKAHYRIGEPIEYIDLSYDPALDGLYPSWEGKQSAFFTPGNHVVTLTVKDHRGLVSKPYTRLVNVTNEVFMTKEEYPFYYGSQKSDPNSVPINLNQFVHTPVVKPVEQWIKDRKVVVSNDPEIFKDYGILYKEHISGKARLYATHVNGMKDKAAVWVMITNPTDHPVTIQTTRKGEVEPSAFPGLLGNQALVDWFANPQVLEKKVLSPGETTTYYHSPTLLPKEGIHFIHDIETDGDVVFSFLSTPDVKEAPTISDYNAFPRKGDVRGTYDVSKILWFVDGNYSKTPWRVIVGENNQWVPGKDSSTGGTEKNQGNYGIFYHITLSHIGRAAISIVPRGGSLKGPVLYNQKIVLVPSSGVVSPGTAYIIGRTDGSEDRVELTLCPPSGSSLPFDIYVYPLDEREKQEPGGF